MGIFLRLTYETGSFIEAAFEKRVDKCITNPVLSFNPPSCSSPSSEKLELNRLVMTSKIYAVIKGTVACTNWNDDNQRSGSETNGAYRTPLNFVYHHKVSHVGIFLLGNWLSSSLWAWTVDNNMIVVDTNKKDKV